MDIYFKMKMEGKLFLFSVFFLIASASLNAANSYSLHYLSICKVNRENIYPHIEKSDLSLYSPEQRQKLSIAATQCGVLTSFSPNPPSIRR
jgi:hypothetical protein